MEKELLDHTKYAKLASHPELSALFKTIEETTLEINSIITAIRNDCTHTWKNETVFDVRINTYEKAHEFMRSGTTVVISKTCTECGEHQKKPEGQPWEICHTCWSPMKFSHRLRTEDKHFIFICTENNCSHGSWHT